LAPLSRNDSLSEGEADFMRMGRASPGSPRRYNKRPLRGPYGQMLEAEMKRASPAKLGRELGFLEALVASPEAAAMMQAPASAPATPLPPPPRQKINAYQMSSEKGSSSGSSSPMVQAAAGGHVHQRAASSPCQLMANPTDDVDRSRVSTNDKHAKNYRKKTKDEIRNFCLFVFSSFQTIKSEYKMHFS
jgi:hypothetical protein